MVPKNNIPDIEQLELPGHGEFLLSQAEGINNRGQIVVSGQFAEPSSYNGRDHVIILTPLSTLLMGDANDDGSVNVVDLGILATNYGAPGVAMWADADFNGDHTVDVSDLGILATEYGNPAAQSVPEPATAGLLTAFVCGLCLLRTSHRSKR